MEPNLSWLTYSCFMRAASTLRLNSTAYIVVGVCSLERFALSFMFFFLLSVAEKTYKQVNNNCFIMTNKPILADLFLVHEGSKHLET